MKCRNIYFNINIKIREYIFDYTIVIYYFISIRFIYQGDIN